MVTNSQFLEGQSERNTIKVIYCRGFRKLLNIKDCTKEKCKYHLDRKIEPFLQGDKIVAENDRVLCGYPKWEQVIQVCEVE